MQSCRVALAGRAMTIEERASGEPHGRLSKQEPPPPMLRPAPLLASAVRLLERRLAARKIRQVHRSLVPRTSPRVWWPDDDPDSAVSHRARKRAFPQPVKRERKQGRPAMGCRPAEVVPTNSSSSNGVIEEIEGAPERFSRGTNGGAPRQEKGSRKTSRPNNRRTAR